MVLFERAGRSRLDVVAGVGWLLRDLVNASLDEVAPVITGGWLVVCNRVGFWDDRVVVVINRMASDDWRHNSSGVGWSLSGDGWVQMVVEVMADRRRKYRCGQADHVDTTSDIGPWQRVVLLR